MSDKIEEFRKRRELRKDIARFHRRRDERMRMKLDAEFEESEHPRDKSGKFTTKGNAEVGGGQAGGVPSEKPKSEDKHLAIPAGAKLRQRILDDTEGKLTIDDIINDPLIREAEEKYNKVLGKKSDFVYKGQKMKDVGENETIRIETPEREALRDKIADELSKTGSFTHKEGDKEIFDGEVKKGKRADIVIGPPAGGKSSVLVNRISKKYGSRLVDSDVAKKFLPEFDGGNGAGIVHKESADAILAERMLPRYYKGGDLSGDNIVIPIVGKKSHWAKEYLKKLSEAGYEVHLSFNDVSPLNSAKRATTRYIEEGRYLSPEYIKSIGDSCQETYEELKKFGGFASYTKYDNNVKKGEKAKLVEQIGQQWTLDRKDGNVMENKVPTEEEKRKIYDYLKKCGAEGYFEEIVEDPWEVNFFLKKAEEGTPVSELTIWMLLNTQ